MKSIYLITRLFTTAFYTCQLLGSSLALLIMFVPIFSPMTPANRALLQQLPNILGNNLLELGIYIIPMTVIIYKLIKNQKLGWIISIVTSSIWLILSFVFANGKPELITLPIINLPLSILGLVTYRSKK